MFQSDNSNKGRNVTVDHYNKALVGMEEIQRLIKARKEKIDFVVRETVQIEEKYLTDAECNLIKAVKLAKDSMVALESSNTALKDELAANAIITAEAVRERDSATAKWKHEEKMRIDVTEEYKRKLQAAEETHQLFRTQTEAWIVREDSSLNDIHERLALLNKELAIKSAECVRLSKELVPYHETLKRKKELESEVSEKDCIITSLRNETSAQKKKIAAYELELAEMAELKLLVSQLREKLSVSEAERARLKAEMEKLMQRVVYLEPLEVEVASLKKNLVSAQNEISRLMEELNRRTLEYNTLSSKYDQTKVSLSTSEQKVASMTSELSQLSRKYEASEASILSVREKMSALEVELSLSKEKCASVEAEKKQYKEEVSRLKAREAELERSMEALRVSSSAAEMKAAEAAADLKSYMGKLKEAEIFNNLKDEEILELKTKLQANSLKLSQAQSDAFSSREAFEERHAEMQKMTDIVNAQEQALENMKTDVQYYKDIMGGLEVK